ncbi:hypothetical protein XENOCAPTIV_009012 [Xenoophorus captivus]|uniref:Uncharacterized protein n=1 Tax=Xenoophorus captivus TaxID=1517983 RepID=A0ABV0RGR1_9TELE
MSEGPLWAGCEPKRLLKARTVRERRDRGDGKERESFSKLKERERFELPVQRYISVRPASNSRQAVERAPRGPRAETMVGPESGEMLDAGATGEKRLFSVAGSRDPQAVENHTEPPPVLAPPQQGPTGHRTTSFSVLDILDPNKFTSSRRHTSPQHVSRRGERELTAYDAENRRGGPGERELSGLEPSKSCYVAEEYQSSKWDSF